jgi:subtilisin family serine protease
MVTEQRHSRCVALIVVLVLLCSVLERPAVAGLDSGWDLPGASDKGEVWSGEILVKLRGGLDESSSQRFFAQRDLDVIKRIPRIDVWLVATADVSDTTCVQRLERSSDVLWVEPNGEVRAQGITPNDNFYQAQQWNLRLIGLPEAWVFTTGDATPIAVIDTGVDLDHPDLDAKIWTNAGEIPGNGEDDDGNGYVDDVHGWNFVNGSALLTEAPHGTHVAGIAGAHTNNSIGIAGVSWQSPLMTLQALNSNGDGTWADVADAIIYAADNGAHILNLSLGGEESSQTIEDAVSYARSQGCLLVAAAGNSESQPAPVLYPAALPEVLAVAATTDGDAPWSSSNRGPEVDLAAPGVNIFSTSAYSQYAQMSGTSMATPHVSGLAALLWSLQDALTADQVTHVVTSTAHDVYTPGWDQRTGWGRIDAQAAVLHIVQPQVDLASDRSSILVGDESAMLTATVTYSQSQPVPDGLTVTFLTNLGSVNPQAVTTYGGQVTATFTSTQSGQAIITASVGPGFQDVLTLTVRPHYFYLPVVCRRWCLP